MASSKSLYRGVVKVHYYDLHGSTHLYLGENLSLKPVDPSSGVPRSSFVWVAVDPSFPKTVQPLDIKLFIREWDTYRKANTRILFDVVEARPDGFKVKVSTKFDSRVFGYTFDWEARFEPEK